MEIFTQFFAICVMLGILSILIVVHECGHFLVARFFGFQTPVFGVGLPFGPHITLGKKWDTEFRIYAFLLGGFVAIPELGDETQMEAAYGAPSTEESPEVKQLKDTIGDLKKELKSVEDEGAEASDAESAEKSSILKEKIDQHELKLVKEAEKAANQSSYGNAFGVELKPFKKFPIWQRALVAVAGVTFNVIFAYLIMVFMLMAMGDPKYETSVRATVPSNPIAQNAGVKANDLLVSIDNEKINGPESAVKYLKARKSTEVVLHMLRDKKPVDITLTTSPEGTVGMVLVTSSNPVKYERVDRSIPETLTLAGTRLTDMTINMMDALGGMAKSVTVNTMVKMGILPKPDTGGAKVGIGDVHGVLAVIVIGSDIAQQDWNKLFLFTILISMDLAIINLLPWPALDGGHLAFMLFEAIRGRPMGERAQGEIVKWGFVSLLVLMAIIMVNDVTALVQGKLNFKKMEQEAKKKEEAQKDKELEKILNREANSTKSKSEDSLKSKDKAAPLVDSDQNKTLSPGGESEDEAASNSEKIVK